jgi:gliding motility-associated-like protein
MLLAFPNRKASIRKVNIIAADQLSGNLGRMQYKEARLYFIDCFKNISYKVSLPYHCIKPKVSLFPKIYILIILAVAAFVSPVFSQADETVCIGAKVMYKAAGWKNSRYDYLVPDQGGQLVQEYLDSIVVQWGKEKGLFRLGVRETSEMGCVGDWAYLNVQLVGENAQFSQDIYTVCEGDSVEVIFDKSDFQAYEWVDKNIKSNMFARPGTYELRTIDKNGCRLSSYVSIVQNPMPKVSLGRDTMICTPGFRLYALQPNTNPQGTIFTWSTDESGTSPFIDIDNHNKDEDILYWVRADFNGCVAADTVVVLACPLPEIVDIPNTFTPNGDGDNDVWEINILKPYTGAVVEIFDRWGRKVFTSGKGYPEPWDGHDSNGRVLPMETYYYIINLSDNRTSKPILGTITIIR